MYSCTQWISHDLSDAGIKLQIQSISESVPIYSRFMKTLKGVLLKLWKDKTLILLFNQSERCLTCRHLKKTNRGQADDQFLPISKGQSSDLDSTDPVKQTVRQGCLWRGQRRPMKLGLIKHLASHKPKRELASLKCRSHRLWTRLPLAPLKANFKLR